MGFHLFFRIHKFKVVLNEKEESVRKLKELLRKSQQHGEESCKMALNLSCQDLSILMRSDGFYKELEPHVLVSDELESSWWR